MKPVYFDQATKVLGKPESMTDEECGPLPVLNDGDCCISCWVPSFRERLSILVFGRVWLWVLSGKSQPPVSIEGKRTL